MVSCAVHSLLEFFFKLYTINLQLCLVPIAIVVHGNTHCGMYRFLENCVCMCVFVGAFLWPLR